MAFHLNGYSNFHDDNQDWIVSKIKSIEDTEAHTEELAEAAQASADASQASAEASQLSADASQASADASQASADASQLSADASRDSAEEAKNYADNIGDPVSGVVAGWLEDNITPTTPIVDESLSISGAAADAKVTGDKIDECVKKNGENEVTPQNIDGIKFKKTTVEVLGENIFDPSTMLFENDYYVYINPNVTPPVISHGTFRGCNSYVVPVEPNTTYRFTEARFAALAKGNTLGAEAVGTTEANLTEIYTSEATYLFLSYQTAQTDISTVTVKKLTTVLEYSGFVKPEWMSEYGIKNKYAAVQSNLSNNGNIQLTAPRTNLRKGERITFTGNITSFDSLKIGLTYGTSLNPSEQKNTFVIDGTNISYYAANNSTPVIVPHGLTIENNIQIIWEMTETAGCDFTLISNGQLYKHLFSNFVRQTIGNPYVLSMNTVLTNCNLSWTCSDLDKKIWLFGDSYIAYETVRWAYYLHSYGYDKNILMDGFPGEGSVNARVAFNNLLKYGTPGKFAVWCMGMNDGSDSATEPAANWVSGRDYFLTYCEDNNITPVFGTIPTVPTINNEQKNNWIRTSGYRYIDFAKAVGASSSGQWYTGMLSSDNVHPSESGAKALFVQVLNDLPEIMID